MQRIVRDQFARKVWSMGLEVQSETAKQVYIESGNLNWGNLSLDEQDRAMFDILILVITTAAPSKSILIDSPYRNVPRKKLQSYLETSRDEKAENEMATPLVNYINFLLGNPMDESLEVDILRVDLEANTSLNADTVDLLCNQLRSVELGTENAVQTSSIIQELTKKYTTNELTKITNNEFFFESTSRKIIEKIQLEKDEQIEMDKKRRKAQTEIATEEWTGSFIKPEFRLSFLAVLKFNLGQKLQKRGETLLECLGIPEDLAAERIVVHEEVDRLIFYLSALYILTNMCSYPILGSPPTLKEVMQILRGEIVKSKLPSFYSVPPLRICKEGSMKRKSYDPEPSHVKRTYHKQQNVPCNPPSSY